MEMTVVLIFRVAARAFKPQQHHSLVVKAIGLKIAFIEFPLSKIRKSFEFRKQSKIKHLSSSEKKYMCFLLCLSPVLWLTNPALIPSHVKHLNCSSPTQSMLFVVLLVFQHYFSICYYSYSISNVIFVSHSFDFSSLFFCILQRLTLLILRNS